MKSTSEIGWFPFDGKPHHYSNIQGWFSFPAVYDEIVESFDNATFVEIGCWLGKSTCYMAEAISLSRKNIDFYCVDTWEGTPDEPAHASMIESLGGDIYSVFNNNMASAGVSHIVKPMKLTSIEASTKFEDNSLDFIFIDGGHTYEDVNNDIAHWLPKLKDGGRIAGHDYYEWSNEEVHDGVKKAVANFFTREEIELKADCWITKPDWRK